MKIILKKAVTGLGGAGTIKNVSDGYAMNFLIPKGLAEMATESRINDLESSKEHKAKKTAEKMSGFVSALDKLSNITLVFKKKATKTGKLFAAISAEEISKELAKHVGVEIDAEMIHVSEPVKSVGEHLITIKLSPELRGEFKVNVEAE